MTTDFSNRLLSYGQPFAFAVNFFLNFSCTTNFEAFHIQSQHSVTLQAKNSFFLGVADSDIVIISITTNETANNDSQLMDQIIGRVIHFWVLKKAIGKDEDR